MSYPLSNLLWVKTHHDGDVSLTKAPEPQWRDLAARQFGVIGRDQALALGVGTDAIQYRLRAGHWRRWLPGVYLVDCVPPSWQQRLKAAQLWAGDLAMVSHRAAAALWRLDGIEPGPPELLTTSRRCAAPKDIILHQTTVLARRDWGEYEGFLVTGLARTLFDLAAVVEPEVFEAAAESALRKNRSLYGEVVTRLGELGGHGRNGTEIVREFLASRDPKAAATESVLETKFVRLLRAAGLPEPSRQHEVWEGSRFVTRLDFADAAIRFGIRLNGKATHLHPGQWQKDQTQGNDLTLLGWTVLDFTWEDVRHRPERVVAVITRAYSTRLAVCPPTGS